VSHVALSVPPVLEQTVALVVVGFVVAVCAPSDTAVVVGALAGAVVAEPTEGTVVVAAGAVVVVVAAAGFFLDAAGDDEPHAAARTAIAANPHTMVAPRGIAARCTRSPLPAREGPTPRPLSSLIA
jgi:hypothetical protein